MSDLSEKTPKTPQTPQTPEPSDLPKLLVVTGETASGKTALGVELAKRLDGEVICADSATVRRGVDIGTAKPTAEERQEVPHHLLDVVEPCGDFTAAVFKRLANQAIDDISARGKLPIMVGGTGLYIDGVIYDFDFMPAGDRQAREELNRLNPSQLLDRIKRLRLDASGVDVRNKRRLIRLIETKGQKPTRQPLRGNTLLMGLKTPREEIEQRMIKRLDDMLEAGLEDEVRALADRYDWDCEALKGIGYAQWKDYFQGDQSLPETRSKIIRATFEYAKRQRTWFKRNKSIHWFHTPVNVEEVVDYATTFLNGQVPS
ncbi:MAG TPA: tRNA (adenosine(37)-N6)-dimethylallyltransferase MiaA [Candidatus Saccharimonadales bacterium]|nr:tRNA (adenosine(37)-N6)-dimethylallyltransferase MiaA [Candidatus Saccharimonadales bacterium]